MRREIKFRAWDGERLFHFVHVGEYGVGYYEYVDSPENLKIMQFTGLCDKNGKEIWEGDIIHVPADEYEPEYKGEVKWSDGYWGFDEFYPDGTLCSCLYLFSYYDDCEVIGNIYSNPGLLERKESS